jgi:dCMP deaminase
VSQLDRVDRDHYYLNIAKEVSNRSTCMRRKYGAVIVKNDEIIATGYNGSPRGVTNCIDLNKCLRDKLNIASGERYELCRSVHAEANAIISASRKDLIDSILYLTAIDYATNDISTIVEPCVMCSRFIINAGIKSVIMLYKNTITNTNDIKVKYLHNFIKEQGNLGGVSE